MGRMVSRGLAGVAGFAVGCVVLLACAPVAGAHAEVVATEPAAGATVSDLSRLVVRFAEPVETSGAHVWLESAGTATTLVEPTYRGGDRRVVEVAVPPLEAGAYTARLHLVAADGDAVAVAFAFTLGIPVVQAPAAFEPVAAPADAHVGHPGELPAGIAASCSTPRWPR